MKISSRILYTTIICLFILNLLVVPKKTMAELGSLQYYAFPGAWAMDNPDGWASMHHIRYMEIDNWRDEDGKEQDEMGDALTGIDKFRAKQYILKAAYIWHTGDRNQFQFCHVGIFPFADLKLTRTDWYSAYIGTPGDKHESSSGMADPYFYNSFGWHNKSGGLHLSGSFTVRFPLGNYDKDDRSSIGLNRYEIVPAVYAHLRLPMADGFWMFDLAQNYTYITKNHDMNYKDKSYMETNLIITYFTSRENPKFGLFAQSDFMQATSDTDTEVGKLRDSDAWSLGIGGGVVYAVNKDIILNLKYTEDIDGKQYRMDKAAHFMLTLKH